MQWVTNFSGQHPLILAACGVVITGIFTAFITPIGSKIIDQLFARRPAFFVRSPVVDSNLILTVEPANTAAHKRRPLGVRFRGISMPNAGALESQSTSISWRIDLSHLDRIREVLTEGADFQLQFFFQPDQRSDDVTIRYIGSAEQSSLSASTSQIYARTAKELLNRAQPNTKVLVDFSEEIISRAFPSQSQHVHWSSVHDGKEATLSGLKNLEIAGSGARILAEPRYAWVLNFKDCNSIALRDVVFGHTEAGYCTGGVLRFESCSDLILERCELFGSERMDWNS